MVNDYGPIKHGNDCCLQVQGYMPVCLGASPQNAETHLITRFGKPIAEVVPPSPPPAPANWMGSMAGTVEILGDIVGPISTEEEWAPLRK